MCRNTQRGMTLLEVLIALSIFAMIGITSQRLLNTVLVSQELNSSHSELLSHIQRSMAVINRDVQFFADRAIRVGNDREPSLKIGGDLAVEFSRLGWRNPLLLKRSQLQRVAYDIGYHPKRNEVKSQHYQSDIRYLRRHYWPQLDRVDNTAKPLIQLLLANVSLIQVKAISEQGLHNEWPLPKPADGEEPPVLIGLNINIEHQHLGAVSRIYRVN